VRIKLRPSMPPSDSDPSIVARGRNSSTAERHKIHADGSRWDADRSSGGHENRTDRLWGKSRRNRVWSLLGTGSSAIEASGFRHVRLDANRFPVDVSSKPDGACRNAITAWLTRSRRRSRACRTRTPKT
jgi:hypothetical protein